MYIGLAYKKKTGKHIYFYLFKKSFVRFRAMENEEIIQGNVNKVFLVGYVGKDPVLRDLGSSGSKVVSFSLATSSSTYEDGSWVKKTEWHTVESFSQVMIDKITKNVRKGRLLHIEGSLRWNSYTDKSGERKTFVKINPGFITYLNKAENFEDPFSF